MAQFRAAPYAKALFAVADDAPAAETMIPQLEAVAESLRQVPEFEQVMVTPMVTPEVKTTILDQILDSLAVDDLVRRFVHVVQQHFRLQHMADIVVAYRALVDRALGRVHATVAVAAPMSASDRTLILDVMKGIVGADVVADVVHDPELIAGFKIQVGSRVFDGSLVGQLAQLGRRVSV
jgi:F-type H+-transporting ATPase subunit delta